jgi:hypothetical protein
MAKMQVVQVLQMCEVRGHFSISSFSSNLNATKRLNRLCIKLIVKVEKTKRSKLSLKEDEKDEEKIDEGAVN